MPDAKKEARTYISPWLRGFTYRDHRPVSETRSTLAFATAATHSAQVALEFAQRCVERAMFPRYDDRLAETEVDETLANRLLWSSEGIERARGGEPLRIAVATELTLYLPSEHDPYTDLTAEPGAGRADLSLALKLPGDTRLQILMEAKAKATQKQEAAVVEGWGTAPLDQPLRYAAIWDAYEHPGSESDDATCRIVGTIEMRDYRADWDDLWSRTVKKAATVASRRPRVAMTDDITWNEIKEIVQRDPQVHALQSLIRDGP